MCSFHEHHYTFSTLIASDEENSSLHVAKVDYLAVFQHLKNNAGAPEEKLQNRSICIREQAALLGSLYSVISIFDYMHSFYILITLFGNNLILQDFYCIHRDETNVLLCSVGNLITCCPTYC